MKTFSIFIFITFLRCVLSADNNSSKTLESLIFISCLDGQKVDSNKNYVGQDFWKQIIKDKPDALFWMGDSIYTTCASPTCVKEGYEVQLNNQNFRDVRNSGIYIDGTWDDNDFGVNDGGKEVKFKKESKDLFLDFLAVPKNSPRRKRNGVYSSHLFGPPNKQVKVILLDTRYNRDSNYIYNKYGISTFAYLNNPLTSILAASLRFLASFFGYGHSYDGDMLGEEQWIWLEKELKDSSALVNIIVSSVQVTTQYPIIESWGHYPKSRDKLFNLIKKTQPKGLIFLSGDVHWGQIFELNDEKRDIIEATSSGITHSVRSQILDYLAISLTFPFYSKRRLSDSSPSYFFKENYGRIDFKYNCSNSSNNEKCSSVHLTITINDLNGNVQLKKDYVIDDSESTQERLEYLSRLPHMIIKKSTKQIFGGICIITVLIIWAIQTLIILIHALFKLLIVLKKCFVKRKNE